MHWTIPFLNENRHLKITAGPLIIKHICFSDLGDKCYLNILKNACTFKKTTHQNMIYSLSVII